MGDIGSLHRVDEPPPPTLVGLRDLDMTVIANLDRLPTQVSFVTALPGGDLTAASLVALYRQAPIANGGANGVFGAGRRLRSGIADDERSSLRSILMFSHVNEAAEVVRVRELDMGRDAQQRPPLLGAVFATSEAADQLDIVLERTSVPLFMAWQLPHAQLVARAGMPLEGVLAPSRRTSWSRLRRDLAPLLRPAHAIGAIVSELPESRRREVVGWLEHHGISYHQLIMRPGTLLPRSRGAAFAAFKAEQYRLHRISLPIEADLGAARRTAHATGERVLAWQQQRMVSPVQASRPSWFAPTPPGGFSEVRDRYATLLPGGNQMEAH